MIFVDTGFLIALADPGDALHHRAMRWAGTPQPLLVSEYVLVEVVNHFSHPGDRARGRAIVEMLTTSPDADVVWVSREWFEAGVTLHRDRPDKAWSLTDCVWFVVMEQRGVTRALAYDHHFEPAAFEALLRRDP